MNLILWTVVVAAVIHIAEEYWSGWLDWARQFVPGTTLTQFLVINALFLLLCIAAALVSLSHLVFSLSVAGLILVNAVIHLVPAIRLKRYIPGLISAILLYIPLGLYAFYFAARWEHLTLAAGVVAALLGLAWMAIPIVFQLFRLSILQR